MKYRAMAMVLVLAPTLSGLVGCRSFQQPTEQDELPETLEEPNLAWVQVVRELGFVPILPPREDVRVGDIYVFSVDPEGESALAEARRLSALSRWGAVPVLETLETEYKERRSWPRTPESLLQVAEDPGTRPWPEAVEENDTSVFSPEAQPKRLRLFGLSPFASMTFTAGDLNRLIPSEAVNVILGTAWGDVKTITLRPRGAESYSLSVAGLIGLLLDEVPAGEGTGYALKEDYRRRLSFAADPGSSTVWIRVLSEVLYIRALDVIVQTEEKFDEDDAVQASELTAVETEPGSEETDINVTEVRDDGEDIHVHVHQEDDEDQGEQEDRTLDPAYGPYARADAINQVFIHSDADDYPGGFMRFLTVTDDSVSLRRVWQRGLAIAVRGLTLEVDTETGVVRRSGPMLQGRVRRR